MNTSIENKVCSKCKEVKLLEAFQKDKYKKDGRRSNCKICVKEYTAKYNAANPEKYKEYRAANPEKIKQYQDKYHAANPEKRKEDSAKYQKANSEKQREYKSKYCKANLEKFRARNAKRRAIKLLAIPSWLTKEDYQAMEVVYKEADRLTQKTGIKHHVDHIHPLQGKLICGFHCPTNFQILTKSENCSKGNRFTPYVESELT